MPSTITFTGAAFALLSCVQGSDGFTLLLSFTQAAKALSAAGVNDALNPSNYSIAGPSSTSVDSVAKISSTVFSLHLTSPVITGTYVITVGPIQSSTGSALTGGNTISVVCTSSAAKEALNQGASNDDAAAIIRKFLPTQYRYRTAWEALIAAVAAGDTIIKDNVYKAFDQLFLSTAVGRYLSQLAADYGIIQPPNVGMNDDLFRKLTIRITAKKLVQESFLEILEVFYGALSTRAHLDTVAIGPYALTAGDSITFLFDNRDTVIVTFLADDFGSIAAATAGEVASVLTRAFRNAGLASYADVGTEGQVQVFSGALGLLGSVSVTGGMANNALQFPTQYPLWSTYPGSAPVWQGERISQEEFRFTWTLDAYAPTDLEQIEVGDYVNIDLVNVGVLRGSYVVSDVHIDVNPGSGSSKNYTWFSITPSTVFPYDIGDSVTITQTSVDEIIFYRAQRNLVTDSLNPSYIAQHSDEGGVDVILPATTLAVNRDVTEAAYLHSDTTWVIDTGLPTVNGIEWLSSTGGNTIVTLNWGVLATAYPSGNVNTSSWNNPTNGYASDISYATIDVTVNGVGGWKSIEYNTYDFSAIPLGSTVKQVALYLVSRNGGSAFTHTKQVAQLTSPTAPAITATNDNGNYRVTVSSSSTAWTLAHLLDPSLKVQVIASKSGGSTLTASLDCVYIVVAYEPP